LCAQLGTSDSLESKFRALEGTDVEDELAQMKRGVLTGARAGPPQQLPEGRPIRCARPVPPCLSPLQLLGAPLKE
jgi:phage shock protein A